MAEFTDRESIDAWLKDQPHQVAIHLAARSALRALPGLASAGPSVFGEYALPALRAALTSAAAGCLLGALPGNFQAAASAAEANAADVSKKIVSTNARLALSIVSAGNAALTAVAADVAAVNAATTAHDSALLATALKSRDNGSPSSPRNLADSSDARTPREFDFGPLSADAALLIGGEQGGNAVWLQEEGLWLGLNEPEGLRLLRAQLIEFFEANETAWGFWKRWYLAVLAGEWSDWELCRDIALIPDDVWQEGPAPVAEAIQRLIDDRIPLNGEAARRQAEILRKEKQSASLCAEGLARYLDEVIRATKLIRNEGLPEPFEPIEALAIRLFKVSQEVLSEGSETDAELAKLLQGSAADIAGLVRKLRDAEAELAHLRTELDEARDDIALKNRLLEAGFKNPKIDWLREFVLPASAGAAGALAPIYLPQLFGAIGSGASFLLGPDIKESVAALSQCYADFVRPEVVPNLPAPDTVLSAVER